MLANRIKQKISIHTLSIVIKIKSDHVVMRNKDDLEIDSAAGTVVLATGFSPDQKVSQLLEKAGVDYHMVGSCLRVGQISEAVRQGFELARKI
jgi:NADH dehydrogenase FAD-containing subunit